MESCRESSQPVLGEAERLQRICMVGVPRTAFVKRHDDVGADSTLCVDIVLRSEDMLRSIDMAVEYAALRSYLAYLGKGEYLESAAVRKNGAVPVLELVQAAGRPENVKPRTQIQMVCVAQYYFGTYVLLEVTMIHSLDASDRSHGHEDGGMDAPVPGLNKPGTRGRARIRMYLCEFHHANLIKSREKLVFLHTHQKHKGSMKNSRISLRLIIMNFLEFAAWGAYLTSLGRYLGQIGMGPQIKWFFAMQGIVSIFMPALMGIVADRKIQAQKVLSLCHGLAGLFMVGAGLYCHQAGAGISFAPLFVLYSLSVAFFMPTIAISNSVAYNALESCGEDPVKKFPPIRIFGTIGFICSMLLTNFLRIGGTAMQDSYTQLISSGIISLVLCGYALTMPECPVSANNGKDDFVDALGLKAFTLFKDRQFAIFFIFSMLLGASLQITNGYANTFLGSFGENPEFANTFAVRNSNALISISQISETLCILLIPFFMKRFGIKTVMLIAMFAWVLRFGFFGLGQPDMPGVLLFILSCIVYCVAFDFFNISGSLYVNENTDKDIRSSAQGLFMLMTNGLGATIGTLAAGAVVDACVYNAATPSWSKAWFIFAGYSFVVAVLFAILFKNPETAGKQ